MGHVLLLLFVRLVPQRAPLPSIPTVCLPLALSGQPLITMWRGSKEDVPHRQGGEEGTAFPPQENFICFLGSDHHLHCLCRHLHLLLIIFLFLFLFLLLFLLLLLLSLPLLQLYHHYAQSGVTNLSPALTAQATNQQLMSISTLVTDRHSFGL
ncbi:unnamed protein product [Pleuronectes platessa]|uniref:Uncharacterized protein n=1 Tax=Pleuronectes platessa TaxID=8262 RepID=A0A9N7YH43_PLEPL|nr:unnamed protein product [Pleuronectes platessa]